MLTPPTRPLPLLCLTMLLNACASTEPAPLPVVQLVRMGVPAPLLIPPPPPVLPPPGTPLTQGRVGELLLGYDAALAACSAQLGAIARLDACEPGAPCPRPGDDVRGAP